MRGLHASIYRDDYRSPCNVLGHVKTVTVVGLGPHAEIFEATPDAPAVRLVRRRVCGEEIVHLVPVDQPEGKAGPMFGGSYVSTSDGRFTEATGMYGAVALHDRFED